MRFPKHSLLSLLIAALFVGGCSSSKKTGDPAEPVFSVALFTAQSAQVTNSYFPLVAGAIRIYQFQSEDGRETVIEEVLEGTRQVAGVTCAIVRVREYLGDLLIEDTEDWYAQDRSGNVWYMGEAVINYNYDDEDELVSTDTDGSWEAGLDVASVGSLAIAGIIMKASFSIGDKYAQETYLGEAEDTGEIVATNVLVTLATGMSYRCLQTRDINPLEAGSNEFKYYAPGVGLVAEHPEFMPAEQTELLIELNLSESSIPNFGAATFTNPSNITNNFFPFVPGEVQTYAVNTEDGVETVISETLDETRLVNGLACRVVKVEEYLGELLLEETHDWYAQDDAGNVWYMGEDVVNFEYDDEESDEPTGTNNEGAWEAGVDGAVAGILMWNAPVIGQPYFQEFYEGEAEDMGVVVRTGVTVTATDGQVYTGCIQTLDWTPLSPESVEYKYYAPGIGVIREQSLDGESDPVDILGTFDRDTEPSLPDFGAAVFTNPTQITHPHLTYTPGTSWDFEVETDEGTETILVEVLATTRVVNGVTCVIVRDRVWLDDVIQEDTMDWYAQDDAGNVWYMGEEVVNYNYEEDGVTLIDTDADGSWESGVDGAVAGIQMWATPPFGMSYYQEFYLDEAEDMAIVIRDGVTLTLSGGRVFTNCRQVLEWTPLEGYALEYKFYAPGVGLIIERKLDGQELELLPPATE